MKDDEVIPPPLPRREGGSALKSLASLLGLMALAGVALHFQLPLPPCPLREMTGVPCPFCGSTRTFAALAHLDFSAALRFNPLVCVAVCGASALWLLAWLRDGQPRLVPRHLPGRRILWQGLLGAALVANWVYLWFHLPR
jgi:hypothetical protein